VYKVSQSGKVTSFGKPGGAPGMFNVVSGIAVDNDGRIFVTDKLKSVVMVFDRAFKFLTEFGYRGNAPGNLIGPASVALGNNGQVYVTQSLKVGVSVFSITTNGS
jgi:DNA-binding beta-propeller fold protein YncE